MAKYRTRARIPVPVRSSPGAHARADGPVITRWAADRRAWVRSVDWRAGPSEPVPDADPYRHPDHRPGQLVLRLRAPTVWRLSRLVGAAAARPGILVVAGGAVP